MRFLVQTAQLATRATRAQAQRTFATSSVLRKDYVQDLYLRELKGYKPAPAAKDAHKGSVKEFSAPKPPTAPTVPSDLAAELSAYEASEPSLAPANKESGEKVVDDKLSGPALLKFLEQDLPHEDLHHH